MKFRIHRKREKQKTTRRLIRRVLGLIIILSGLTFVTLRNVPPQNFPVGELISIEPGTSLRTIAASLEAGGVVRSAEWFLLLVRFRSDGGVVVAGDYIFDKAVPAFRVVDRMAIGDYGPTQRRITIPEGSTARQIADLVVAEIPDFPAEDFFAMAAPLEGYLFPDTYQVFPSVTPEEFLELLLDTYRTKVGEVFAEAGITDPDQQREVLIMASMVEREAFGGNYEEHRMVAGILYNRLRIGMRLQVDATLHYILGKTSAQLTRSDLRMEHPYNTYVIDGLPPGPISNPGLLSIRATLDPATTDYFFYLHDDNGTIRYAVTHDGHVDNKNRYLR